MAFIQDFVPMSSNRYSEVGASCRKIAKNSPKVGRIIQIRCVLPSERTALRGYFFINPRPFAEFEVIEYPWSIATEMIP